MTDTVREHLSAHPTSSGTATKKPYKIANTIAKNSMANVVRLSITSLIAIILPPYLTHHLSVQNYGAWVLILQLGAYVGYLDFGVQTAVSKYIAEFDAKGDYAGCGRSASAGLVIMMGASAIGVLLTLMLAWRAPELFRNMPTSLLREVRISVLFVGISLSISLATSVFSAIFLGLQQYQVSMATGVLSRLLYGAVICLAVALHSSLATMGAAVAAVNLLTALLQVMIWRRLAPHVNVTLRVIDVSVLRKMLEYCGVLTVWSVCMLFISGIDITIVGHYAFNEVAFYSIATSPTTLILSIIGAVLGPLLPAASAMSVERSPEQMGTILLRITRYSTIILLLTGLPALVGGYLLLRVWVGEIYSLHSIQFLRILLLANILRNLCAPYATIVVATSRQNVATISAISEAVVNLVSSIWLAKHFGAMGVAMGTLLGAAVGVLTHFGISMHFTKDNLSMPRTDLILHGLLRPMVMGIPSALLLPYWWLTGAPTMRLQIWLLWGGTTLLLAWFGSLNGEDRSLFVRMLNTRLRPSLARG
jgi:O-antigen/teichoic acid export membrane protein